VLEEVGLEMALQAPARAPRAPVVREERCLAEVGQRHAPAEARGDQRVTAARVDEERRLDLLRGAATDLDGEAHAVVA
jgi:hypothetical protein